MQPEDVCAQRAKTASPGGRKLRTGAPSTEGASAGLPLPPVPLEGSALASVIGANDLLRLIECRGGTSLHLGEAAKPTKRLAERLGLSATAMAALRREFGKTRLKVPLLRSWRAQIYQSRGMSYIEIALKLGVSDSTVHVYLRDAGLTMDRCALERVSRTK